MAGGKAMDHMGQPCEAQGGVRPPLGLTGLPPLLEMGLGSKGVCKGVGTSLDKGGCEMDGTDTHRHGCEGVQNSCLRHSSLAACA